MVSKASRRSAIVTGAGMGQGADAAKWLASRGYAVGLIDISEEGLKRTHGEITAAGGRAMTLPCDVSKRSLVAEAADRLENAYGPIWISANVAGILPAGGFTVEMDESYWQKTISINLFGVVNAAAVAAQHMIAAGEGGRIVNWSSLNAVLTSPGFAPYGASKAAVEMFTKSFAIEIAQYRITVNCVRPGSIYTPMMFDMDGADYDAEARRIPMGRWGEPKDTTAALKFFVSEEAEWITGSVVTVDGGALSCSGMPDMSVTRHRIEKRTLASKNK